MNQGPKPKACVRQVLSDELANKIEQIISYYGPISFDSFPTIYYLTYGQHLDATSRGFYHGFHDLIEQSSSIGFTKKSGCLHVILTDYSAINKSHQECNKENEENVPPFIALVRNFHRQREYKDFFLESNIYLWQGKTDILHRTLDDIIIVNSPYLKGLKQNERRMLEFAEAAHHTLSKFPYGVPLNQLYIHLKFDKKFLNQTSIADIVTNYPEIFHIANEENELGQKMIFDGKTITFDNLTGSDLIQYTKMNAHRIASCAIISGAYQMTLMMIKKAHHEGLKLCVWFESLKMNCDKLDKRFLNLIEEIDPFVFFLALTSVGLVQLKSRKECKNDIRIHLPEKRFDCYKILLKGRAASTTDSKK